MDGDEAHGDEADSGFSNDDAAGDLTSSAMTGSNPATLNDSLSAGTYLSPTGMSTAQGEVWVTLLLTLSLKWRSQYRNNSNSCYSCSKS